VPTGSGVPQVAPWLLPVGCNSVSEISDEIADLSGRFDVIRERTMSRRETIAALREAARKETAELVRQVAHARGFDETVQACIARAALRLGWSFSRTEDIWRREARRIESFEMDQLRRHRRKPRSGGATPTS
jgi:hypothetical protein